MMTARQRRIAMVLLVLVASSASTTLILQALRRHVTYLYTPSELTPALRSAHGQFRLGGIVVPGSFHRQPGQVRSAFRVSDGQASVLVIAHHMLPDLFREGQAVVASGRIIGGAFHADQVLARHNETYTPHWGPKQYRLRQLTSASKP